MVKLLLENGASPDLIDAKGKTSLDYASKLRDEKLNRLFESFSAPTHKSSSLDQAERIEKLKIETEPKEEDYEDDFEG